MTQSTQLLETLKKELRAAGCTYKDVAASLGLSEASIKRMFAEGHFTLERLEQVCELAGLTLTDLVEIHQRNQRRLDHLTEEQEKEIASDIVLLMVAVSVINGFSFSDLTGYYRLSEPEVIRKLARLDKLKLLDLLPGNRIKLRISPNFRWLANGPIQKFFLEKVEKDFFSSRFDKETEKLLVLNGLFSKESNKLLQEKMDQLSHEFTALMKQDAALQIGEKFGTTMVLAVRQWQYNLFAKYLR